MSSFLRLVGIINAAIWFGGGIFFATVILPGVFSHDMRDLFHETTDSYYTGGVALVLFRRFFVLQYICGVIALLHLFAEKFYLGRALPKFGTPLVLGVFALSLVGGLWLEPRMETLRHERYFGPTVEQKENARHSFGMWHGISQCANLLIIGGLLVNLARVSRPSGPLRHGVYYQIP